MRFKLNGTKMTFFACFYAYVYLPMHREFSSAEILALGLLIGVWDFAFGEFWINSHGFHSTPLVEISPWSFGKAVNMILVACVRICC